MSVPLTRLYKVYYAGKILYVAYTGIPLWGWVAYEAFSLTKCMYFDKPADPQPMILYSENVCCGKASCECLEEDKFEMIS